MRFKTFLQERLADKEIKDIQNVIAGAAEKDITYTEKISDGVVFSITGLGSWVVFKRVFTEAMTVHGWKNESKDGTNLCFKYRKLSLWIKYEQSTARFFLTDKNVDTPHWEEEKESDDKKDDSNELSVAESANEVWYHAGNLKSIKSNRPIFLAKDEESAKWYLDRESDRTVEKFFISGKSLNITDKTNYFKFIGRLNDLGVITQDGNPNEFYCKEIEKYNGDPTNPNDVFYIPTVLKYFKTEYDYVLASDVLENSEIPVAIVLNTSILKSAK